MNAIAHQIADYANADNLANAQLEADEQASYIMTESGQALFSSGEITIEEAFEHAEKESSMEFYEYLALTAMKKKGARSNLIELARKSSLELNEINLEMANRH